MDEDRGLIVVDVREFRSEDILLKIKDKIGFC